MNIIHIANINNNKTSGVTVAVQQHINWQSKYANVAFYNFKEIKVELDKEVTLLDIKKYPKWDIKEFPYPFNNPDLVIFHDVFACIKFNKVAKTLYKNKIPFIIVPHGSFTRQALDIKKFKKQIALKTILKTLVYKASAIQYLSEVEKKNSTIKNRYIILPNGTNIPDFNPVKLKENDGISFVYIGRKDIYYKGIDYLLDACKIALPNLLNSKSKVSIYGPDRNGSFAKIDDMIEEYELSKVVKNIDGVVDDDKVEVFKSSDVFILTSRSEGHPLSVLEAWSYGLPTLLTPGTGLDIEAEKNKCGWGAELSAESIAEQICYILENKDKISEYSYNAYEYVKKEYAGDNIAKLAIDNYKDLIEGLKND